MSAVLEDRVWRAHPLSPAHRCVLVHVAKQIPTGGSEILVTRTIVAQALDTSADTVSKALIAGEQVGVCRVLKNGRVAFGCYDGVLGVDAPPVKAAGTRDAPPSLGNEAASPKPTVKAVMSVFGKHWYARYGRLYPFKPGEDHRLAGEMAGWGTLDELDRAALAYLDSDDPFYAQAGHGFRAFHRNFHKFVIDPHAKRRKAVSDADARAIARAMEAVRARQGD